jgi:hypothetical protein
VLCRIRKRTEKGEVIVMKRFLFALSMILMLLLGFYCGIRYTTDNAIISVDGNTVQMEVAGHIFEHYIE